MFTVSVKSCVYLIHCILGRKSSQPVIGKNLQIFLSMVETPPGTSVACRRTREKFCTPPALTDTFCQHLDVQNVVDVAYLGRPASCSCWRRALCLPSVQDTFQCYKLMCDNRAGKHAPREPRCCWLCSSHPSERPFLSLNPALIVCWALPVSALTEMRYHPLSDWWHLASRRKKSPNLAC